MDSQRTVGALLFEGFELLDVFGPLEAWGMLAMSGACRIVTTAERAGSVASAQGPKAIADHALAECPKLDVILVPGGVGTRRESNNPVLLDWLRQRSPTAEIVVTSVCTGAALLARAGLLDGRQATSNKRAFPWVVEQGPRVQWIRQARWVEDDRFVTSSGVSAGIDMTLAVIAKLTSIETAEKIAVRMEYVWHRDSSWDPFAKVHEL